MGYSVQTLDEKTWLIEEEASCNVYMYLLAGESRAVLLDTGYGTLNLPEIVAGLTDLPVTVLCTHGHFDHIGGATFFQGVLMHRADRELYHEHRQVVRQIAPDCIAPESDGELAWFEGDMTLDLGGRTLEVFHVPGHTKGCVAVLDVERRQLFTGDTCCKAAVLMNFDHSTDVATFRSSIERILAMRGRYDITWPSHHAKPVGVEIPQQFLTACDILLSGKGQVVEVDNPFGKSQMLAYQDVSIIF